MRDGRDLLKEPKKRIRKKCTLKTRNWYQWKASCLRSSWRGRAKKLGFNLDEVPTRQEIEDFLNSFNGNFTCYLTGTKVMRSSIELDHKVPTSRNGTFRIDNVGITSKYFNSVKGSLSDEEFIGLFTLVNSWEDKGVGLFKRLSMANNMFRRRR
jgi:5-methylcytosine-specific restriction endonuclease McrA